MFYAGDMGFRWPKVYNQKIGEDKPHFGRWVTFQNEKNATK